MIILIIFAIDSIWNIEKHNTIKAMVIPLILAYPFHVNTLGDIIFAFVLRFVKCIWKEVFYQKYLIMFIIKIFLLNLINWNLHKFLNF